MNTGSESSKERQSTWKAEEPDEKRRVRFCSPAAVDVNLVREKLQKQALYGKLDQSERHFVMHDRQNFTVEEYALKVKRWKRMMQSRNSPLSDSGTGKPTLRHPTPLLLPAERGLATRTSTRPHSRAL